MSPVRDTTAGMAEDAMETEEVATCNNAPEAAMENRTMAEAGDDTTKENKAPGANVAAAEEEAQKVK